MSAVPHRIAIAALLSLLSCTTAVHAQTQAQTSERSAADVETQWAATTSRGEPLVGQTSGAGNGNTISGAVRVSERGPVTTQEPRYKTAVLTAAADGPAKPPPIEISNSDLPEAGTWAQMLAGLAVVGMMAARRRDRA